jgi:ABC-type sulfate transport system substrate-binding protein
MKNRYFPIAILALLLSATQAVNATEVKLLNASYDVSREFYNKK